MLDKSKREFEICNHTEDRTIEIRNPAQFRVSRRSLQRIIYDDLNLFPYKVQITSRLNPLDLSMPGILSEFFLYPELRRRHRFQ